MKDMPYEIIENKNHDEWLKARTRGIGGSDAAAVLGISPYKSNVQLFKEKTGLSKSEDISDKPYVKYGTEAEPHIRALFALDYPEYKVDYYCRPYVDCDDDELYAADVMAAVKRMKGNR